MKAILTADWHLGYAQYGNETRRQDFIDSAFNVIQIAIDNHYDCILNAGDLLDVSNPARDLDKDIIKMHEKLVEAGIPMVITVGNHDNAKTHVLEAILYKRPTYPDKGLIFNKDSFIFKVRDAQIACINFDTMPKMKQDIAQLTEKIKEDKTRTPLLMCHMPLLEFAKYPSKGIMQALDFPEYYDAILVGDTHICKEFKCKNGTQFFSPGTIELKSKSEDRKKCVWTYDTESKTRENLILLPTRKVFDFDITDENSFQEAVKECYSIKEKEDFSIVYLSYPTEMGNIKGAIEDILKGHLVQISELKPKKDKEVNRERKTTLPDMNEIVDEVVTNKECADIIKKTIREQKPDFIKGVKGER